MDLLEWVQRTAIKIIRGSKLISYDKRLRYFGCFSLEKRRLQGDLFLQYLRELMRQMREDKHFRRTCCDRTRM